MLSVLPFNNTVDRVLLTGAAVLQVLEWNLAGLCPDQSCDPAEFFQVGGARLSLVVREDNVAITSFLTLPGKSPIGELILAQVRGPTDYEVLVNYIKLHSPLQQTIEGRIKIEYIE